MLIGLLLLSTLTGCAHIYCEYKHHYPAIYTLKPLTILIIIFAVLALGPNNNYQQIIIAGLVFSMAGDCFLMLRQQQFIAGLLSFLVAHILYCVAFYQQLTTLLTTPLPWHTLPWLCIPALAFYAYLWSGLDKLKAPVLIYISAIVMMAFLSLAVYLETSSNYALAAFIGALIFMVSDASLALNKFKLPFVAAQAVILSTYYLAQWGIAYSAL
ncbi:MAG: putative membrane protein YhhN [Phenylobacterium sp.]|jgi:uncharacterized membrane protein YhhN